MKNEKKIPGIIDPLKRVLKQLTKDQLMTPYRPNGWTIQQVVHHLADNDMNAFLRFKRGLTEDEPMASSYRQDLWAELEDYKHVPVEVSIQLLDSIHTRFFVVLKGMNSDHFTSKFNTQVLGTIPLDVALQRFIWHNEHHIAQIIYLMTKMGWKLEA
ncbi:YfiT family bacillithiol transferase [Cohnella soli]|uniref:YfiT family bacillithiol transferase n=1 Tax=Cohnella soli TaxID=425005 RepID=A0ABW0HZW0_9BACL